MKAREDGEIVVPIKKKFSTHENSKTYHEPEPKEYIVKSKGKEKKVYKVKQKKEFLD